MAQRLYVISYDVPDSARRYRLAKLLLSFGDRVQRSVFECALDDQQLHELLRRLDKLVKPADDLVRLYNLGMVAKADVILYGAGTPTGEVDVIIV